ncbi:hypothetical protein [Allokutzneria multivorans]|uniref:hypothetical protein n=1 Tax=Allokutzneria multivorans TaxID=1142134 RepID=UPI0031E4EA79
MTAACMRFGAIAPVIVIAHVGGVVRRRSCTQLTCSADVRARAVSADEQAQFRGRARR